MRRSISHRSASKFACWSLFVAFTAGSAIACSTEEAPTPDDSPTVWNDPEGQEATWAPDAADHTEWKFKDTTTYVKSPKQNLVTVAETSLRFPSAEFPDLLPLAAGDVLIGNAADDGTLKNPSGFLRKIVSVAEEGGEIVVTTEEATLADAFETCDMAATFDLSSLANATFVDETDGTTIKPESFGGGLGGPAELEANAINFNVANVVLFNEPPLKASVTKGSFSFAPAFHFELDAAIIGGLKHFEAVATGTTTAELEVKLETTQAIVKDFTKTFGGTPSQFSVGPLEIVVTPKLVMGCSVNVPTGNITVGAKATSVVALGVEYDKSTGLKGIAQSDFELTRNGPNTQMSSAATARCFIRPSIGVEVGRGNLGHGGANLEVEASGDTSVLAAAKTCKFDFTVGVKADVDLELVALGFEVVDKDNLSLFNKSTKLVDDGNCAFLSQL